MHTSEIIKINIKKKKEKQEKFNQVTIFTINYSLKRFIWSDAL